MKKLNEVVKRNKDEVRGKAVVESSVFDLKLDFENHSRLKVTDIAVTYEGDNGDVCSHLVLKVYNPFYLVPDYWRVGPGMGTEIGSRTETNIKLGGSRQFKLRVGCRLAYTLDDLTYLADDLTEALNCSYVSDVTKLVLLKFLKSNVPNFSLTSENIKGNYTQLINSYSFLSLIDFACDMQELMPSCYRHSEDSSVDIFGVNPKVNNDIFGWGIKHKVNNDIFGNTSQGHFHTDFKSPIRISEKEVNFNLICHSFYNAETLDLITSDWVTLDSGSLYHILTKYFKDWAEYRDYKTLYVEDFIEEYGEEYLIYAKDHLRSKEKEVETA